MKNTDRATDGLAAGARQALSQTGALAVPQLTPRAVPQVAPQPTPRAVPQLVPQLTPRAGRRAALVAGVGLTLSGCQAPTRSSAAGATPTGSPATRASAVGVTPIGERLLPELKLTAGANEGLAERAAGMSLSRIAFGSCADQERPQPIWQAVFAYEPQLFLFGGDNVYGDRMGGRYMPDHLLVESLKTAYRNHASIPAVVKLRNTVPHLATWDDHDYGKNDAGVELPHKRLSQQLFLEYWAVPAGDPRRQREGIYSAQTFGPTQRRVQVILLDTRYFRSPLARVALRLPDSGPYLADSDPAKTLLGDAQWAWLREQLLQPAQLRLVVSSIQVLAVGHQWERWETMPRERQRLFDLIRQTRANGVVFLSGDRHVGALYRESAGVPYPLVEMTSSGLTQSYPANREPGPNRLGEVYGQPNFGGIDIDWAARTVELSLRSVDGELVRQVRLRLDEMVVGG